jgi:3-phosphoshikimate 1-carboxyvinyltransferase
MNAINIYSPNKNIRGEITLSGSKSISNRVLLIKALCHQKFEIFNLSESDDTSSMEQLIHSNEETLDAHHAGTTFRFLTAYLAIKSEKHILTGSDRMKQRPVKALVDALNYLGANIEYVEKEGFPPLRILPSSGLWKNEISLPADISSQYISALLLIAPVLAHGLKIHLEGEIVSRPYIEMTIGIMSYFGVSVDWEDKTISIRHQQYIPRDFHVEADWSAASYYYTIAGLSETADIILKGLHVDSLQGDSAISEIGNFFGIKSVFGDHQVRLLKRKELNPPEHFEYNFIKVPDIAQSISVLCGGLGTHGLFTGLQTLRIKETDRIAALQQEHAKIQVYLNKMPAKFSKKTAIEYYMQEGKATADLTGIPEIDTYNDHRMAMAFAPLGLLFPIKINDPEVISKSYTGFWKDLISLGFEIK